MIKARLIRLKKTGIADWGAVANGIIWAIIYKGKGCWRKTDFDREWYYVVEYVSSDGWEKELKHENFKRFKDARKRALEIAIKEGGEE